MSTKLPRPNVNARYVTYPTRISNQRRPIHSDLGMRPTSGSPPCWLPPAPRRGGEADQGAKGARGSRARAGAEGAAHGRARSDRHRLAMCRRR